MHGYLSAGHAGLELVPGRRRRPEQVRDEGEHGHQKKGSDETPVMVPAANPKDEADDDRQRKVHEVEEHRHDVLGADDVGLVERVLQGDGWQRPGEQRALEAGEVVRRKARLSRITAHGLVSEEEEQEWSPVDDKRPAPTQRDCDHKQCEHDPLGLDRDPPPQHDSEDQRQVDDAADNDQSRSAGLHPPCINGCGQPLPLQSRQSLKTARRWRRGRPGCACRPRRARRRSDPKRR